MTAATITISVVSHGQGRLVAQLLDDLARTPWHDGVPFDVIVTINTPEDERWLPALSGYPLTVVRNDRPKGFGANHNAAIAVATGKYVAVVNPDVRLFDFRVGRLIDALQEPAAGVCGPLVLAPGGTVEDSARRFPTMGRLLRRRLLGRREADYSVSEATVPVDWLAGMFLLFPTAVFREVGGFDERYFMYLEDVELGRRLRQMGLQSLWVSSTAVVHDAARASGRSLRHLSYHLASTLRYFLAVPRG